MRRLLTVLGVIGLVIVIVGAVNHAVDVRVDYLVGTSSDVSLFWFALAVAILIVAAGFLGLMAGRASQAADRRKLEKELDDTYRRLREAQAAVPAPVTVTQAEPSAEQTVVAAESVAAPTVIAAEAVEAPADETVVGAEAFEPATTVEPASFEPTTTVEAGTDELDTTFSLPRHEAETGGVPPAVEPQIVEPQTVIEPAPLPPAAPLEQPGEDDRSDEAPPPIPPI